MRKPTEIAVIVVCLAALAIALASVDWRSDTEVANDDCRNHGGVQEISYSGRYVCRDGKAGPE
jgi:hypothetical protein